MVKLSTDELVEKISAEIGFFDPFPVSVLGRNYSAGLIDITMSKQPGPRGIALLDLFGDTCVQSSQSIPIMTFYY